MTPDPDTVTLLKAAEVHRRLPDDLLHVSKGYLPDLGAVILTLYGQSLAGNVTEYRFICNAEGALEYGLLTPEEFEIIPTQEKQ